MNEPRKPTPMTPERAQAAARRCRLVAACALTVAAIVFGFGNLLLAAIPVVVAAMFLLEARSCDGWRRGYLARERDERTEAGDRR